MAGDSAYGSNPAQAIVCEKPKSVDKIMEGNMPSVDDNMDRGEELVSGNYLNRYMHVILLFFIQLACNL